MSRPARGDAPEAAAAEVDPAVDLEGVDPSAMLGSAATPAARESAFGPADSREIRESLREIWGISWPVMLSQVLLNVVGLVDIAMVGRLGAEKVAAVGYATQFSQLSQSVLYAVGFATVALMSHAIATTRSPSSCTSGCIAAAAMSTRATRQPSSTSARTTARPIVPPAPVTSATLPASGCVVMCRGRSSCRTGRASGT